MTGRAPHQKEAHGLLHNLTGWHAIIILAIVLLLFGATKLPALAKSIGQSTRILKTELSTTSSADTATPQTPVHTSQPEPAASSERAFDSSRP